MKYIKDWTNYHKIDEALDVSQASQNLLNSIQKNPTLPLLTVNSPRNNSTAPYVKLLQDTLSSQGYSVDINGVFDEKTKQAVIDYQSSDGLLKDGKVGKDTWKSILALNDINIQPKIVSTQTTQKPNTNTNTTPNQQKPEVKPTTPENTQPQSNDFTFKNTKGAVTNFSALQKATNRWYDNKDAVAALIQNNKDNKRFILELNKLYQEKTDRNLIGFLTDVYSRSLLGGRTFEIGVKLFDTLTNYIVDPASDAKIFNWCISGSGTEDELIKIMFNKRAKMPEDYKKKILAAYQENYENSFSEDMVDDGIDEELIKKIDSDYFETES